MTPSQRKFIKVPEDVTSLCESAITAYNSAGGRAKSKVFTWRGKKFKATWSIYAINVHDMQGNPIAQRVW